MKLYGFFRSATSHRTRIVLNLKNVQYQQHFISLAKYEHHQPSYQLINPQGFVPVLVTDAGTLTQSPAIIEWLEEQYPVPALLPIDAFERARVRAMAALLSCDIHPLNNKRVLDYLRKNHQSNEAEIEAWCQTWIKSGFSALETLLASDHKRTLFCYGDHPTIADAYLIPQVYSARRFNADLSIYPNIMQIYHHCMTLDAFKTADPENQPDAF